MPYTLYICVKAPLVTLSFLSLCSTTFFMFTRKKKENVCIVQYLECQDGKCEHIMFGLLKQSLMSTQLLTKNKL